MTWSVKKRLVVWALFIAVPLAARWWSETLLEFVEIALLGGISTKVAELWENYL